MKTKTVALTGLLIALALVLSYLESLVPLSFAVPGIKLGLPNLVIVFALYRLRPATAAAIWARLWATPPATDTPVQPKRPERFKSSITAKLSTAPAAE